MTSPAVLVTGAAGGLGRLICEQLVSEGWTVFGGDLREPSDPVDGVIPLVVDVTDAASTNAAVAAIGARGSLDALINNAAIYESLSPKCPFEAVDEDEFDLVMRVNVRGTWQMTASALPLLREAPAASVVNISSASHRSGAIGFPHYAASKAAVEGLTRAAARELGSAGIRVNAVAPGLATTPASLSRVPEAALHAARERRALPVDLDPAAVASAVIFLAGPASSSMTGQVLVVDNGEYFA